MRHPIIRLFIAVAFVACLTGQSMADGSKHRPQMQTFSGAVSTVSSSSLTVVQQKHDQQQSETFRIDESTRVLLPAQHDENGKPRHVEGSVADLRVGDRVMVGYTEDRLAKKIAVQAR
jgi:hypothetical protein